MTLDKALYPTKVHSTGGWKNIVTRLALIGFALAAVTGAFAYFGGWFGTDELTPGRFADRFEEVNGLHPGFRRNHAKGLGFPDPSRAMAAASGSPRPPSLNRGACQ